MEIKQTGKLTEFLTVRFRPADHKRLWDMAWQEGRSLASLARKLILSELSKRETELATKQATANEQERSIQIVSNSNQ